MSGKNPTKKTVGIRTDITFEINDDVNINSTTVKKKKKGDGKNFDDYNDDDSDIENASVPVFKGTKGVSQSAANDANNRRFYPSDGAIFHKTNDENNRYGGSLDNWSNFIPSDGVWTTERNYFLRRKGISRIF